MKKSTQTRIKLFGGKASQNAKKILALLLGVVMLFGLLPALMGATKGDADDIGIEQGMGSANTNAEILFGNTVLEALERAAGNADYNGLKINVLGKTMKLTTDGTDISFTADSVATDGTRAVYTYDFSGGKLPASPGGSVSLLGTALYYAATSPSTTQYSDLDSLADGLNAGALSGKEYSWSASGDTLTATARKGGAIGGSGPSVPPGVATLLPNPIGAVTETTRGSDPTPYDRPAVAAVYKYEVAGIFVADATIAINSVTFTYSAAVTPTNYTDMASLITALNAHDDATLSSYTWSSDGNTILIATAKTAGAIGTTGPANAPGAAVVSAGAGTTYSNPTVGKEREVGTDAAVAAVYSYALSDSNIGAATTSAITIRNVTFTFDLTTPDAPTRRFNNAATLVAALNANETTTAGYGWSVDSPVIKATADLAGAVGASGPTAAPGVATVVPGATVPAVLTTAGVDGVSVPMDVDGTLASFETTLFAALGELTVGVGGTTWTWSKKAETGGALRGVASDLGAITKPTDLIIGTNLGIPTTGSSETMLTWTGKAPAGLEGTFTNGSTEGDATIKFSFAGNRVKELNWSALSFKLGSAAPQYVILHNGDPLDLDGQGKAHPEIDDTKLSAELKVALKDVVAYINISVPTNTPDSVIPNLIASKVMAALFANKAKINGLGNFDKIDNDYTSGKIEGVTWTQTNSTLPDNSTVAVLVGNGYGPDADKLVVEHLKASEIADLQEFWPNKKFDKDCAIDVDFGGYDGDSKKSETVKLPLGDDSNKYLPSDPAAPHMSWGIAGGVHKIWVIASAAEWTELSKLVEHLGWDDATEAYLGAQANTTKVGVLWKDYVKLAAGANPAVNVKSGDTIIVQGVNGRFWPISLTSATPKIVGFKVNGVECKPLPGTVSGTVEWNDHVKAMGYIGMSPAQRIMEPQDYNYDYASWVYDGIWSSDELENKPGEVRYLDPELFLLMMGPINDSTKPITTWDKIAEAGKLIPQGYNKFEYEGVIMVQADDPAATATSAKKWHMYLVVDPDEVREQGKNEPHGGALLSMTLNGVTVTAQNYTVTNADGEPSTTYGLGGSGKVYDYYKRYTKDIMLSADKMTVAVNADKKTATYTVKSWTGFEKYNNQTAYRIPWDIFETYRENLVDSNWDTLLPYEALYDGMKLNDHDIIAVKTDNNPITGPTSAWWLFQVNGPAPSTDPKPDPDPGKKPDTTTPSGGGGGGGSSKAAPAAPAIAPSKNVTEFVTALYKIALGRDPDKGGLENWTGLITSGKMTPAVAVKHFLLAEETVAKNLTNAEFVELLYNIFMGRKSDKGGLDNWVGLLVAGMSKESVINHFFVSPEFTAIQAAWK